MKMSQLDHLDELLDTIDRAGRIVLASSGQGEYVRLKVLAEEFVRISDAKRRYDEVDGAPS